MFHIFHDWKWTKTGLRSEEFDGSIRKCQKCGKRQKLSIHILGYSPYKYVETWYEIPSRKKK